MSCLGSANGDKMMIIISSLPSRILYFVNTERFVKDTVWDMCRYCMCTCIYVCIKILYMYHTDICVCIDIVCV